MNKILYIGLNGYAGAGKDTVAKMLKVVLNNLQKWTSFEEYKEYYFHNYTDPTKPATYNNDIDNNSVICLAYADQLKQICSSIFGIPLQRFYMNKSNAWICINDKFQYTEIKPESGNIITAEEFFYNGENADISLHKQWMSLREILVYVGTYVLQQNINKSTFVNIVRNKIKEEQLRNPYLKYVIVTDNRFDHELNFIRENNGITITIRRDSIQQLDNIAEHELDNEQNYDYIIDNSGSYDDLIRYIWDMVHDDIEFANISQCLYTRDNIDNYLRLVKQNEQYDVYKLCAPLGMQQLFGMADNISALNPVGGPQICVGEVIDGTISEINPDGLIPSKIVMNEETGIYYIYVEKNMD